jgi:hypothetical protein
MATTAAVVGGASYVGTRKATQVGQEEEARQQELADAQQPAAQDTARASASLSPSAACAPALRTRRSHS